MYTLFNEREKRYLKHPRVGLWFTPDKHEAENMLSAAKQYVKAIGMPDLANHFSIVEISEDSLEQSTVLEDTKNANAS